MVFSKRRATGAALAAVLASAPAIAQPPEAIANGVTCVYEKLTANRGYEIVAEVFLRDDVPETMIPQAASILELTTQSCAQTHGWSISRTASASDVGLYRATIDYLLGKLGEAGAPEPAVEAFKVSVLGMAHADYAAFGDQDWRSDIAFTRRLRGMALEAGLPDEDVVLDMAMDTLELGARTDHSVSLFLLDLANSSLPPA